MLVGGASIEHENQTDVTVDQIAGGSNTEQGKQTACFVNIHYRLHRRLTSTALRFILLIDELRSWKVN